MAQAIPIARDANNQETLSYLLCWLQQLSSGKFNDTSGPSEWNMLEALSARTKQLNQHSLHVISELGKAKWGMNNGQPPEIIDKFINNALNLTSQHRLLFLNYTCMLTQIAAWELYGKSSYLN